MDNGGYTLIDTASGWAVRRQDGCYAEFLGSEEAAECLRLLASGERGERDYDWNDPEQSVAWD